MDHETDEPTSPGGFLDTRILMMASAGYMALLGLAAAIFPDLILDYLGQPTAGAGRVLLKLVGGLYLGFAVLNWMARGNLIGGIYSRPVALGNFAHFLGGAIVLLQQAPAASATLPYAGLGALAALFAASFGYITFAGGGSCG